MAKKLKITRPKKASIYIFALAAAMVLVTLVVGLSTLIMQFRRSSRTNVTLEQTRLYAELGLRHALYYTTIEPNWRNLLQNGVWLQDIAVDRAIYTVEGVDPDDGDLTNGGNIELTCTATVNGASRSLRVQCRQGESELMRFTCSSSGPINILSGGSITGDVTSNTDINISGGSVNGNVEASGSVNSPGSVTGTVATGTEPKAFPVFDDLLSYYLPLATVIPYQSSFAGLTLNPASNPFGSPNPNGVYVIDCGGQDISFAYSNIRGTLILLNMVTAKVTLTDQTNWQTARADFPALIGDGKIHVIGASTVDGVVYAAGKVFLTELASVTGAAISNTEVSVATSASITAGSDLTTNPLKAFGGGTELIPIPGTWQQIIQ